MGALFSRNSYHEDKLDRHRYLPQKFIPELLLFSAALGYGFGNMVYPAYIIEWWGVNDSYFNLVNSA